jgi:hypothetical protein
MPVILRVKLRSQGRYLAAPAVASQEPTSHKRQPSATSARNFEKFSIPGAETVVPMMIAVVARLPRCMKSLTPKFVVHGDLF